MNQSHNTSKKPGIFTKLKSVAERLFSRKVYPPSIPCNPQPVQGSANRQFNITIIVKGRTKAETGAMAHGQRAIYHPFSNEMFFIHEPLIA